MPFIYENDEDEDYKFIFMFPLSLNITFSDNNTLQYITYNEQMNTL